MTVIREFCRAIGISVSSGCSTDGDGYRINKYSLTEPLHADSNDLNETAINARLVKPTCISRPSTAQSSPPALVCGLSPLHGIQDAKCRMIRRSH